MLCYHCSPLHNLPSIERRGLLTSKARGAPRVWVCSHKNIFWALAHTVKRHKGRIESVLVLLLSIPRSRLRKGPRPGLYFTAGDVSPDCIKGIRSFGDVAS